MMPEHDSLLKDAIVRNTSIAISLPDGGLQHSCRSRFLSLTAEGIVIESLYGHDAVVDVLIQSGQAVKVSFRTDVRNVEFATPVLKRLKAHPLNDTTVVEAILIPFPEVIKAVQRRSDYRVSVPKEDTLKFSFWRVNEQDDFSKLPPESVRIVVDVRDCSSGGIGGIWNRQPNDPATLAGDQRFRVDIESPVGKQTFDARLRFLEDLADPLFKRVGLQFALQSTNLADRQKTMFLNKLMGELQRMELRRKKIAR